MRPGIGAPLLPRVGAAPLAPKGRFLLLPRTGSPGLPRYAGSLRHIRWVRWAPAYVDASRSPRLANRLR